MILERPQLFVERDKLSSELRRRRQAAVAPLSATESAAVVLPSSTTAVKRTLFSLQREGSLAPPAQRALQAVAPPMAAPPRMEASGKRLRVRGKTVGPSWGNTASFAGGEA